MSWVDALAGAAGAAERALQLANEEGPAPQTAGEKKMAEAVVRARAENPWFTPENIRSALSGLAYMLRPEAVREWAGRYENLPKRYTAKKVGIVAAGNIPMVAFHDILCALAAGHKAVVKLSAQDRHLLPAFFALVEESGQTGAFELTWTEGRLGETDAVIATGSNNTARYFEYYFGNQPHIIRKNRNTAAVLDGTETEEELYALGTDIFSYFGLGCRNVSKIYVPEDYDLDRFFNAVFPFRDIVNHHKYANNYDYYKALWLMNGEELLDNNFLLLRRSEALAAPPGVLYYERYGEAEALRKKLREQADEIQCIVSHEEVPFGKSQKPELWDYADGVDTMDFLLKI